MEKVKRRQWTQREIKKAIKMYHDGELFVNIGKEIGRSKSSARGKLVALGIHEKDTFRKMANTVYLWDVESVRGNLINVNEAKQTTAQSNKKLLFKCSTPNCNNTKMMVVHSLVNHGFSCATCSTGTSYPELFFISVNQHFKLGYEYQQAYEHGRFDFINYNTKTVIEMNGRTHYEEATGSWDNAHKNTVISDDKKRKWCKENGYKLIFIDARKSDFKFIQDNINECELLPTITDEDIPSLLEIIEQNKRYPVKEVCDMYLRARKNTYQIAEHYGYDVSTINDILRRNNVELRDAKSSKGKKVKCVETGEVFNSGREASRETGISQGNISSCCNGKLKSAGGYHFEYLSNTEENAHHRASLVAEQESLDDINLDSSIDLLAMFNKEKV